MVVCIGVRSDELSGHRWKPEEYLPNAKYATHERQRNRPLFETSLSYGQSVAE